MKKTCNGCRAEELHKCVLGYKTKEKYIMDVQVGLIPLEDCPKPTTYEKLLKEKRKF